MRHIKSYLARDHRRCDELVAAVDGAARAAQWTAAADSAAKLASELSVHFAKEEQVLFPFFDSGGRSMAPVTAGLRAEHSRMLVVARDLASAAGRRDARAVEECVDALNRIMEEHNASEERLMFTTSDELLGEHADRLIAQMERISGPGRDGHS